MTTHNNTSPIVDAASAAAPKPSHQQTFTAAGKAVDDAVDTVIDNGPGFFRRTVSSIAAIPSAIVHNQTVRDMTYMAGLSSVGVLSMLGTMAAVTKINRTLRDRNVGADIADAAENIGEKTAAVVEVVKAVGAMPVSEVFMRLVK